MRQVRIGKANVSEPLMTCRNTMDDAETEVGNVPRNEPEGYLPTAQAASGTQAARARSRLLCGTWEPVAPILGSV